MGVELTSDFFLSFRWRVDSSTRSSFSQSALLLSPPERVVLPSTSVLIHFLPTLLRFLVLFTDSWCFLMQIPFSQAHLSKEVLVVLSLLGPPLVLCWSFLLQKHPQIHYRFQSQDIFKEQVRIYLLWSSVSVESRSILKLNWESIQRVTRVSLLSQLEEAPIRSATMTFTGSRK